MTYNSGVRRGWLLCAVAAATLLAAACSAGVPAAPSADPAAQPAPQPTAPPLPTDQPPAATSPNDPASAQAPAGEPPSPDATVGGGADQPPGSRSLSVQQRHPSGVSVTVTGLTITGNDIQVDAEFVNGTSRSMTINSTTFHSRRLRLVDSAGNEYNFAEEEKPLQLRPAETLTGTFVFRGPLVGDPDRLVLVTNVSARQIDDFDISTEYGGRLQNSPAFVVPLERP